MLQVKVLASSSRGNCTYITDSVTPLLLDVGLPLPRVRKGLDFGLSKVAGALITHSHKDHCCGVSEVMAAGVECYMLQATAEALGVVGHHRVHIIKALEPFTVETWRILPFDTPHDVPNVGFLLSSKCGERVLYLTDTPYCAYRFDGLTRILIEVNYDLSILKANVAAGRVDREVKRRVLKSHMSLEHAKQFLKANDLSRVQQVVLLHLSDENSDAAQFKKAIQAIVGCLVRVA